MASAVVEHRHPMHVMDALDNIETSGTWLILMNVQTIPEYKALLHEALASVNARVGDQDPGMFHRAFWIFIQSPWAVTPYHIDHENNFLMQLSGKKLAQVWQPELVGFSNKAMESFHADNDQADIVYRDDLASLAANFDMLPGTGLYMPSTSPHYVANTDCVSIGMSMTFCTAATHRIETIHRGNRTLRRLGIKPTPLGTSPALDQIKYRVFKSYLHNRARLLGKRQDIPGWARI